MRGGHNQTHGDIGRYRKLDSFYVAKFLRAIKAKGEESLVSYDKANGIPIVIGMYSMTYDGIKITFDFLPCGFGTNDRCFILCPACGKRYRYLYLVKHNGRHVPLCRKCAKLNYPSQQITHGVDECARRMERLLQDKFHVITEDLTPDDALWYFPLRPKGMRQRTYKALMAELRRAQEEYHDAFEKALKEALCRL